MAMKEIMTRGDMEGRAGTTLLLNTPSGSGAERLLLVGLGKEKAFHEKEFGNAIRTANKALNETGAFDASLFLMGTSDPDAELTMNGAAVARYGRDGVWGVLVTLSTGANTFALQNGTAALSYTVNYAKAASGGTYEEVQP